MRGDYHASMQSNFKSAFAVLKEIGYDSYMALECAIAGNPEEELAKCVDYLRECML